MADAPSTIQAKGNGHLRDAGAAHGSRNLSVAVSSGDALDVRRFSIRQHMSSLFAIDVMVYTENAHLDFDALVGQAASFTLYAGVTAEARSWSGICNHIQHVGVAEAGLSTYELRIVPTLWLATQRKNHRMFQQMSEPDIVKKLLGEWGVVPELRLTGVYKKRKYRVQYGETDFAFISRMLEEAGISFFFDDGSTLMLSDAPQEQARRAAPLPYRDNPTAAEREYVTKVRIGQQVRPGRVTLRDHDPRLAPRYPLGASAAGGSDAEARLEQFEYAPGLFQFRVEQGESTPFADDKGKVRSDEKEGATLAKKRLDAQRGSAKTSTFETNVTDLAPGVVMGMVDHPRAEGGGLLVVASEMVGDSHGELWHRCEARSTDTAYRPEVVTPKPRVAGVESATVVGPAGDEIHTDEFGRVRVAFHWDRESTWDDKSSCWIHVSQPWAGATFGGTSLPRVGQEVLVDFLGGDPDKPIIVGRVYTNLEKTPYKLPENKTQSGWKSSSSPCTGGYNEIMFEDAAGRELVRVQAEKDLHKLVKHDEDVTIGNDRTKLVGNDDKLTVENDRTKMVQNDENVTIGNDRTETVTNNETITIGNNRTETVTNNETITIGNNRTETVTNNETITIRNDRIETVTNNETITIGNDRTETVTNDETITINNDRTETVANDETITIGNNRTETVTNNEATTIRNDRTESVVHDETITIGHNQTVSVQHDDVFIVGNNRTMSVQMNEREVVGASRTRVVGHNEGVQVAGEQSIIVGKNQGIYVHADQDTLVEGKRTIVVAKDDSLAVVGSSEELVSQDSTERVGVKKTTNVEKEYQIVVGDSMNTNVTHNSREYAGLFKTITAGTKLQLVCGKAKITMIPMGVIILDGIIVERDPAKADRDREKAERDQEKASAAKAAVEWNDAAATSGTLAGLCALTGVGEAPAAVFGIYAGVAWLVANRYQTLANDPPRNDFHEAAVFKPYAIALPPGMDGAENAWRPFIEGSAFLALALQCLTTSHERSDGVALAIEQAHTDELEECGLLQEGAIQRNATAAADLIDALVARRDAVNAAWRRQAATLQEAGVVPSPELARMASAKLIEDIDPWMRNIVQADDAEHARMRLTTKTQMMSAAWSKPPDVLLDDGWRDTMRQMSLDLRSLARASSSL